MISSIRISTLTLLATALVAAGGAAASLPASRAVVVKDVVVKDPENRFTISVPADWNVRTSTSSRAPAVVAEAPAPSGQLPDSVDVITQDLPKAVSAQGCADKATVVMRYVIHRWTTLAEGPAQLAGLPAYSRSYAWRTMSGQDRRSVQTCVTLERRAFVIVATTANTAVAAQNLPKLQQIMATFRPNTTNLPGMDAPGVPHGQGGGSR